MKKKPPEFGNSDKTPTGECPLCYTQNAYTVSLCSECNLPLPWAKAEIHEREPSGHCLKCHSENPYTTLNCWSCGGRLPWANAVSPAAAQLALNAPTASLSLSSPSAHGHGIPTPVTVMPVASHVTSHSMDSPNQIVDVVSFLCPPLGFVAYVTLLGQLPRTAANAVRYSLYGLGVWTVLLMFFLVLPHAKFGRSSTPAPVTTVATGETANEIYQ